MLAGHDSRARSPGAQRRRRRWLVGAAALSVWLFVLGFLVFAGVTMRPPHAPDATADAIVVLTGTEGRLVEGARLLRDGRAARMLVSGVNGKTRPEDIQRLTHLDPDRFNCCVDLGYQAQSTIGNAEETRAWARQRGYKTLIVVTSGYHIPRSMAELTLAMPEARLIAHPVGPKSPRKWPWWLDIASTRTLLGEYVKFLPVAARLTFARVMGARDAAALTSTTSAPKPSNI